MPAVTVRFTLFYAKKLTKSEHKALQTGVPEQLDLGRTVYTVEGKDALFLSVDTH